VLPDRYFPVDALVVAMTQSQDVEPDPVYYAEVLQADANLDIAVIRVSEDMDNNSVSGLNLPFVPLGDSDTLNLGDSITILGYPGIGGDTVTLTRGEVSGFTSQPQYGQRAFIKTSATIAGGNSGGLALDNAGHIIGVPTQLGYGGDDQFVDCRVLADTNRDGTVDDLDSCVPTGGFINALRPIKLALPFIEAAQRGETAIVGGEEPATTTEIGQEPADFSDDFSDESTGWDVFENGSEAAYYQDGVYVLEDVNDPTVPHAQAHHNFGDLEISVDAQVLSSDVDDANEVAVFCRYQDGDNYYGFRVYQDGNYGIYKVLNGEFFDLASGQSNTAALGDDVHTIQVLCEGSRLGLGIDGAFLTEADDDSFSSGDVALSITAWEGNSFSAAFDNFQVTGSGSGQSSASDSLYTEDFSNPNSGWTEKDDAEVYSSYDDGQFVMGVIPDNYWSWNVSGHHFSDVVINVDTNVSQAAGDGDFGILCRYVDADNFYALEVSEDGYYAIWKMVNGESVSLVEWQQSSLIPTDGSAFILNASCDGAQLQLGVNAELVAEATDGDFSAGDVGLIVGSYTQTNFYMAFDNFEVLAP
jgi:S1-C subfamily serine protease